MIQYLRDWVDHRTGLGKVLEALLLEHIPGGAKWRYVWGSALAIVFGIQVLTGVLLMTAYSPGDTTAWGSVYFIQYEMDFGWFIRGLHHFGSQTMVVLLALHMLQVVIAGAHLNPREVNWWLGLGLAGVILGLSLTGYLLPWDQKGFYATQVATNIAGGLPGVGAFMRKVVVGGSEYGNHTLTRFFALHVAILPGLAIVMLVAHIWVFRRHGVTHPKNPTKTGWFWPDQAFRDLVVGLIIFAIMVGLVLYGWGHKVDPTPGPDGTSAERSFYDKIAHAGKDGRGANLDAPADPRTDYPARPEWYFLFLFQLLKHVPGLAGTVVIPTAIAVILLILPLLGYGKLRPLGHLLAVIFVVALLGGVAFLTAQAWVEDQSLDTINKQPYSLIKNVVASKRYDPDKGKLFQNEMKHADERAARAIQLAAAGIPSTGARDLLPHDPMTTGKSLFKTKCAACHTHLDPSAEKDDDRWMNSRPTASDLTNWGSEQWIRGLLNNAGDDKYFGRTHLKNGDMSRWVKGEHEKVAKNPARAKQFEQDLDDIAAWLATHPRKQPAAGELGAAAFAKFSDRCASCHDFLTPDAERVGPDKNAPELTGYGDAQWLREMIMVPNHRFKYGKNNRMPAFRNLADPTSAILEEPFAKAKEEALKDVADAKKKEDIEAAYKAIGLTDLERELIIRFLIKDDRVVFGGEAISGPPVKK